MIVHSDLNAMDPALNYSVPGSGRRVRWEEISRAVLGTEGVVAALNAVKLLGIQDGCWVVHGGHHQLHDTDGNL